MIFLQYPKCSTCKKAQKWLDENKIEYQNRNIVEENPTETELKEWFENYNFDIKKLFNTCGMLYKSMNLKDKLPTMTNEEKFELLATDGMLVKRPLIITEDKILFGFKEKEWQTLLDSKEV